jgi:GT2 family glycosyltransferase
LRLRCACAPEPGLSRARNRGIAEAAGEVLVFLDDDALARPGWLRGYDAAFQAGAEVVQGRILPRFEGGRPRWLAEAWLERFGQVDQSEAPGPLRGRMHGGNCAVRREVFDRVGIFREELGAGASGLGEDTDFGLRAVEAGIPLHFEPRACVDHLIPPGRATRRAFLRRCYRYGWSQPLFERFDESPRRALFYFARRSAGNLVRATFALDPVRRMAALSDLAEHWGRVRRLLKEERRGPA